MCTKNTFFAVVCISFKKITVSATFVVLRPKFRRTEIANRGNHGCGTKMLEDLCVFFFLRWGDQNRLLGLGPVQIIAKIGASPGKKQLIVDDGIVWTQSGRIVPNKVT